MTATTELDLIKTLLRDYEQQTENLRKENQYLRSQLDAALEKLEGVY